MLDGLDELILMRTVVDEVVIALPLKSQHELVGHAIEVCQQLGIQSQYFTGYFGSSLTKRRSSAGPRTGRVVPEVVHPDSGSISNPWSISVDRSLLRLSGCHPSPQAEDLLSGGPYR